jgi:hypothetical protein
VTVLLASASALPLLCHCLFDCQSHLPTPGACPGQHCTALAFTPAEALALLSATSLRRQNTLPGTLVAARKTTPQGASSSPSPSSQSHARHSLPSSPCQSWAPATSPTTPNDDHARRCPSRLTSHSTPRRFSSLLSRTAPPSLPPSSSPSTRYPATPRPQTLAQPYHSANGVLATPDHPLRPLRAKNVSLTPSDVLRPPTPSLAGTSSATTAARVATHTLFSRRPFPALSLSHRRHHPARPRFAPRSCRAR